jgi:hypothetical protein
VRLFNGVVGLQDKSLKLTGCQLAKEGGTCGSDKLTVALLSSTNRAIMQTDPNAHHGLIDSSARLAFSAQPRWRTRIRPRALLLPTPRTGRRWHPGPAEVPIDISGPRSRIINKCCNGYRSRSDLHRDLIPQARAALGWPPRLGPLALSGSPRRPTGRGVPTAGGCGPPRPR